MTVMPNSNDVQRASPWSAGSRALVCRAFLRVEKVILESLGPLLSARQYVALLFEVYLAEIEGKTLYQACLSTDEIVSTVRCGLNRILPIQNCKLHCTA